MRSRFKWLANLIDSALGIKKGKTLLEKAEVSRRDVESALRRMLSIQQSLCFDIDKNMVYFGKSSESMLCFPVRELPDWALKLQSDNDMFRALRRVGIKDMDDLRNAMDKDVKTRTLFYFQEADYDYHRLINRMSVLCYKNVSCANMDNVILLSDAQNFAVHRAALSASRLEELDRLPVKDGGLIPRYVPRPSHPQ